MTSIVQRHRADGRGRLGLLRSRDVRADGFVGVYTQFAAQYTIAAQVRQISGHHREGGEQGVHRLLVLQRHAAGRAEAPDELLEGLAVGAEDGIDALGRRRPVGEQGLQVGVGTPEGGGELGDSGVEMGEVLVGEEGGVQDGVAVVDQFDGAGLRRRSAPGPATGR